MGLRNDVKQLKQDMAEIKANFSGHYIEKAKKLDEVEQYLSFIKLKVKSVTNVLDANGKKALKIIYEAPQVTLTFDDGGNVMLNEIFRSINALDLIDMNDKMLILKNINQKNI